MSACKDDNLPSVRRAGNLDADKEDTSTCFPRTPCSSRQKGFIELYLYVSMCYLVVMQVFEALQYLPRVEADGGLVVLQRTPLGPQQSRQTPCTQKMNNRYVLFFRNIPDVVNKASLKRSPPGTCSMKILMKPFSLMEPRYCTMFLCFRCLWRAISSWSGWEYLNDQKPTFRLKAVEDLIKLIKI